MATARRAAVNRKDENDFRYDRLREVPCRPVIRAMRRLLLTCRKYRVAVNAMMPPKASASDALK